MLKSTSISRRHFVASVGALAIAPSLFRREESDGRLATKWHIPRKTIAVGEHALPLMRARPTLLYVPASYKPDIPAPIVLCLHGATGAGVNQLNRYRKYAEQAGAIVLSPSSEGVTWDAIRDGYGADCAHIDAALDYAFDHCAVDRTRIAVAGFSDGASYSLSLGIINGSLFTHAAGFSPGFLINGAPRLGKPAVFISHGVQDDILPIDRCGRPIARELKAAGYAVTMREFEGGHQMPETMIPEAAAHMGWKLK